MSLELAEISSRRWCKTGPVGTTSKILICRRVGTASPVKVGRQGWF